jgi:outer membrane receptor protein involved in Fe transport
MAEDSVKFDEVTVTGAREGEEKSETALTVQGVDGEEVREDLPTHPSEVMNQIPGVLVNVTQGEGHMTAIRQPLTTSPVYLYLEDGIPTRSTGFFNHNALYETNLPQSDGVEVLKGPGTALYGSDALGGIINVLTRPAPDTAEASVTLDSGKWGERRRLQMDGGNGDDQGGYRISTNLSTNEGWRDDTRYDRDAATLRLDDTLSDVSVLKTVLSYSKIDQQTAGSSALSLTDYETDPTINSTPISFRNVTAARLSTSYEKESGSNLTTVTPYMRHNTMDILPNWSLSYDPTIYETFNDSLGVLLKHRMGLDNNSKLIIGADVDYSPGGREEIEIIPLKTGSIYTSYTEGVLLYDYDVTFSSLSPYIHGEMPLGNNARLSGGLRYDMMRYDYDTALAPLATGNHRRPDDTVIRYGHASPKLGVVYNFSKKQEMFFSYRHGFRAPSEGQLFRQGSSSNTVDLEPVKLNNVEVGWRWRPADKAVTELSVYSMKKTDDILSFNNPVTLLREVVNAGETSHQGVELLLGTPLAGKLYFDAAWSYAIHTYKDWVARAGGSNIDYSDNRMAYAPRVIGNTRIRYGDVGKFNTEVEWTHVGPYWMDDANTHKYEGHGLLGMTINIPLSSYWKIHVRGHNLNQRLYAERASYHSFRGEEYSPGMPRTVYASLSWQWQKKK